MRLPDGSSVTLTPLSSRLLFRQVFEKWRCFAPVISLSLPPSPASLVVSEESIGLESKLQVNTALRTALDMFWGCENIHLELNQSLDLE